MTLSCGGERVVLGEWWRRRGGEFSGGEVVEMEGLSIFWWRIGGEGGVGNFLVEKWWRMRVGNFLVEKDD